VKNVTKIKICNCKLVITIKLLVTNSYKNLVFLQSDYRHSGKALDYRSRGLGFTKSSARGESGMAVKKAYLNKKTVMKRFMKGNIIYSAYPAYSAAKHWTVVNVYTEETPQSQVKSV